MYTRDTRGSSFRPVKISRSITQEMENRVYHLLDLRGCHYSGMVSWPHFIRVWKWHRWRNARKFHTFATWPSKFSPKFVYTYPTGDTCRTFVSLSSKRDHDTSLPRRSRRKYRFSFAPRILRPPRVFIPRYNGTNKQTDGIKTSPDLISSTSSFFFSLQFSREERRRRGRSRGELLIAMSVEKSWGRASSCGLRD